jgi:hypothetical protein
VEIVDDEHGWALPPDLGALDADASWMKRNRIPAIASTLGGRWN